MIGFQSLTSLYPYIFMTIVYLPAIVSSSKSAHWKIHEYNIILSLDFIVLITYTGVGRVASHGGGLYPGASECHQIGGGGANWTKTKGGGGGWTLMARVEIDLKVF